MPIPIKRSMTALLTVTLLAGCTFGPGGFVRAYESEFTQFRVSYQGHEVAGNVDEEGAEDIRREALELLAGASDRLKGVYLEEDVHRSFNESDFVQLSAEEIVALRFPNAEAGEARTKSFIIYLYSPNDMFHQAVLTCVRGCSDFHVDDSRQPLADALGKFLTDQGSGLDSGARNPRAVGRRATRTEGAAMPSPPGGPALPWHRLYISGGSAPTAETGLRPGARVLE